jgi:hypothetical protein
MTVSMYLSVWCADKPYAADCKLDDDGDVKLTFSDTAHSRDSIGITMSPRQFKTFVDKLEDLRNGMELAEAAGEYAENHPDGEKINRQQEAAEILEGIGDNDDVAF